MESAISNSTVYYHGTNERFDNFDLNATRVNRGLNVSGVYFTPFEREARTYGNRIIRANLKVSNPFYSGGRKNKISKNMLSTAREILKKHTHHNERWIENALLPELEEKGNIKVFDGLSGDLKRELLLAGGYDAYIDGHQLSNAHVVVLEPNKRNIILL